MFKGKSLACSLTCTFSALRSRDLQKCSPPSPAPQCQARSKDTSAERKVRRRRIIPRPSCNWATHPQPGKPREGSGSLERSLQTKVRNDAGKIRGQSSSGDGTTLGRGHWLFRERSLSPVVWLSCWRNYLRLARGENSEHGDFPRTGVNVLERGHDLSAQTRGGLDCEFFKGRHISCTSLYSPTAASGVLYL